MKSSVLEIPEDFRVTPSIPVEKLDMTVVLQDKLGGVATFYANLLSTAHRDAFDLNVIYVSDDSSDSKMKSFFGLGREFHCHLSEPAGPWRIAKKPSQLISKAVCLWRNARKVSELISNEPGLVLVNHPIELLSLTLYPRPRKCVVFMCHDVAYLKWAVEYESVIDVWIAHNTWVHYQLLERFPSRADRIHFVRFGINIPNATVWPAHEELTIVYLARLHVLKGIHDLVLVDKHLQERGVRVNWLVLGDGPEREAFLSTIQDKPHFHWESPADAAECMRLASKGDIFLLPSSLDGTPLALLETMALGLVPIVYEFCPGIHSVVSSELGFVLPIGDTEGAARHIQSLDSNRSELKRIGGTASAFIKAHFELEGCNSSYFELFGRYARIERFKRISQRKRIGRLNIQVVPFIIAQIGRYFKKQLTSR